jgi:hypothetical protein
MDEALGNAKDALARAERCGDFAKFIEILFDRKLNVRSLPRQPGGSGEGRLGSYLDWIGNTVLKPGASAEAYEAMTLCSCFRQTVVYTALQLPGRIHIVIPGESELLEFSLLGVDVDFRAKDLPADSDAFLIDEVELVSLRRLWEILGVCDEGGKRIPFPKITCVRYDGAVMTVAQMHEYATRYGKSAVQLCKEMEKDLQQIYASALRHIWKYHNPIILHNSGGHWKQSVLRNS